MRVAWARLLLGTAYPFIAHAASTLRDPQLAALALLDIVLILLVVPLARGRAWAFATVGAACAALWAAQASVVLPALLLLPPVLFPWLVAWYFARTLHAPRVPLITRICAAVEGCPVAELSPAQLGYTRALTRFWALLLAGIGVANLLLGVLATPDGLLVQLGVAVPVQVPQAVWSWCANLLDYGLAAIVFGVEYLVRARRFPDRRDRNLPDFVRRLGALGPGFWRDVMR